MNNGKTRSTLLGFVGAYLVYMAYGLFQDRGDTNTTMTLGMRALFIAIFAAAGLGLMVYAVCLWRRALREERERDSWKDENSLK